MHEYHYIGYHFVRRSDCTFISFYAPKEFSFDYLLFCFLILMPMAHTVSENSHCSLVIKPSKIKQYKCDPRIVPIWLWCVAVYQNLSILSIYHLCLSIFLYPSRDQLLLFIAEKIPKLPIRVNPPKKGTFNLLKLGSRL